jgi:hypothetical protein
VESVENPKQVSHSFAPPLEIAQGDFHIPTGANPSHYEQTLNLNPEANPTSPLVRIRVMLIGLWRWRWGLECPWFLWFQNADLTSKLNLIGSPRRVYRHLSGNANDVASSWAVSWEQDPMMLLLPRCVDCLEGPFIV